MTGRPTLDGRVYVGFSYLAYLREIVCENEQGTSLYFLTHGCQYLEPSLCLG